MNADAITARILEDARSAASNALNEARARADRLKAESDDRVSAAFEAALVKARADGEELHDRMLRMAELDERKELLAMKREMIDLAFQAAVQRMRGMNAKQARAFLEARLLEAANGDEEIVCSGEDAALYDAAFLSRVNAKLASAGKSGKLTLSKERRAIAGGFVLTRGGVETNCAIDALVGQVRPLLEADAARALFD